MVTQQLVNHIREQLQQGMSPEQIKSFLLAGGWKDADINEAFASINFSASSTIPPENIAGQQFSAPFQRPKRRIKKTLLAVISLVGILLIGGGALGYFYYFRQTPAKVVEKMKNAITDVKSFEYQGETKIEFTAQDLLSEDNFIQSEQQTSTKQTINFFINFTGKDDIGDLNNPKGLFVFNIKTDALKEITQEEFTFGLEVRNINKVFYIKLNNLPNLGFFDLDVLSNQWIKIDT